MAEQGLGTPAARGVASMGAAQVGRALVQVTSVVVLSRLLDPAAFGVFAVAWGIVGLADLVRDLGLQAAAVRAPSLSHQQGSNLFWLGLGMGAVLAALTALAAPLLGAVFDSHDVMLVVLGLAPTFLLSGAASQYRALLLRRLRFPLLSAVDVGSALAGLVVAVVASAAGLGYWALVLQLLTSGLTALVVLVRAARWVPDRFRRGHGTRAFVTFGGSVLVAQMFVYASNTLDSTMVGFTSGQSAAGEYNRGAQVIRTPLRQFQSPLATVAVPVIARLPRGDARVSRLLETGQVAIAVPVFGLAALCAAVPDAVVRVALGAGWEGAAPVLVLIALATAVQVIGSTGSWALIAHGDGRTVALVASATGGLALVAMAVGAVWGPVGVAAGALVAAVLNVPVNLTVVRRTCVVDVSTLWWSAVRLGVVAGVASLAAREVVALVPPVVALVDVLVATAVLGVVLVVAAAVWPAVRRDVLGVVEAARAVRRRDDA